MPLVAAGLPVLQALGIRQRREPSRRVDAVLVQDGRQLHDRRVLELVQSGGEQVVDGVGGLLRADVEEAFDDQHPVAELALLGDLPLVGEQVVAQVDRVGEGVAQHPQRAGGCDGGRDLGVRGVLDEVRRPGRTADLAAHLDVLDRVGQPTGVDVGEFPERLVEQVAGAHREPCPPVGGPGGHGSRPQVREPTLDRVRRFFGDLAVDRHEGGQPVEIGPRARHVVRPLVELQEVVVEVEDPHIPVGDEVQPLGGGVGMRVGAQQGVVVGVEVPLGPDRGPALGRVDHLHGPGPRPAVLPGDVQMGAQARRIGHVEFGEGERLHDSPGNPSLPLVRAVAPGGRHRYRRAAAAH